MKQNKLFKAVRLLCFIFCIMLISGCDKKVIYADLFREKMEEKGYIVDDVTTTTNEEAVIDALIAYEKDYNYKIEFIVFKSESIAKLNFASNRNYFQDTYEIEGKEESYNNYSLFIQETDEKYNKLSRINDTMIYISVDKKYKNEVENIIKELGY